MRPSFPSLRRRCLAVLSGSVAGLVGCVSGTYTPPQPAPQSPQYERVVNKSFNETWTALIDYTSQAFFGIDRFEKESGLMTLNFGSSEPARYIDCGHMKAKSARESIDMPYVDFLNQRYNARLDGKMNLVVRSLGTNRTVVRVNARYVFSYPAQSNYPSSTWTFDSGGEAKVTIPEAISGTIPTRTCRPTYAAELAVLDAISQ